jgi:hypothetical protein
LLFNGATPFGSHFSDWRTKSGASAQAERYNQSVTLTSLAITSLVLTVSLSTCPVMFNPFSQTTAQLTLNVQSISTEPSVSNPFK